MADHLSRVRRAFGFLFLTIIFLGIIIIFWHNQIIYNLPTPVPQSYKDVKPGTQIDLPKKFKAKIMRPVFIHFFNPDCPCSRFNIAHFKSLVKKYGDKVNFSIVAMSKDTKHTAENIQETFDLPLPVFFDQNIASSCGVYSTPQAVIIDTENKLYYRGNYNKSRYCTNKNSNYAQMAIDSLINEIKEPVFNSHALKAYGCELPHCNKPK